MSTYWENYLADKRYTCFKEKSVDVVVVVVLVVAVVVVAAVVVVPEFAC